MPNPSLIKFLNWITNIPIALEDALANALTLPLPTNVAQGNADSLSSTFLAAVQATEFLTPGGRLTLLTNLPVMNQNLTGITKIIYTPYIHSYVPIFTGLVFVPVNTTGEVSQLLSDTTKSPAAAAANSIYDIFGWVDGSTFRATRGPAWTGLTARGTGAGTTEIIHASSAVLPNSGIYVNRFAITNGPAAQQGTYLGTICTDANTQLNHNIYSIDFTTTAPRMDVWNCYNRKIGISTLNLASTASYTYGTNTSRLLGGSANAILNFVSGLPEDSPLAHLSFLSGTANAGVPNVAFSFGVNIDSTATPTFVVDSLPGVATASGGPVAAGPFTTVPQIGYHFLAFVEQARSGVTFTVFGGIFSSITTEMTF